DNTSGVSDLDRLSEKQQKIITGQVIDKQENPISGVNITAKGTNRTVLTNEEGRFTISDISPETVLVVSHLGFKTQEIAVRNRQSILVIMEVGLAHLDEVMVIGYGEVSRGDLTGSVAEVKVEDMRRAPVASIDQALAGRVAGVQVRANDGQPGSEMNIVIRGGNSLTQDNSPLYVIDGFPVEDLSLMAINPDDVKSINVLKDASATAIYGSRGANGVVVIETKGGEEGKTQVRYEGAAGIQQVTKTMELMDTYEFVKYQIELNPAISEGIYLTGPEMTLEDYRNVPTFDWQDRLFRTSNTQLHNLSISGGNKATKFLVSGSLYDFDGVIINSGYNRKQGRIRLDHQFHDRLRVFANVNYSSDENYGQLATAGHNSSLSWTTRTMYQTWGYRPVAIGSDFVELEDEFIDELATDNRVNPVIAVQNEVRKRLANTLNATAFADYSISNELTLRVSGGIRNRTTRSEEFYNSLTNRGFPRPTNTRGVNGAIYNDEFRDWMNENLLTYKKRIN
ncbi:SusC/RagA family TonB-linked outer membrane protein, partial [Parapusillimonas sp. SGNA-6]|nr:SusC/RagA family TonB-linked outer membrane protein [Parapusillimonas sp. SGNA-6]